MVNRPDYIEVARARVDSTSSYDERQDNYSEDEGDDADLGLLYSDADGESEDELARAKESSWPATSATIVSNSM